MGCANSKSKRSKCNNVTGQYSSVSRSYSMFVHHPPSKEGDSYHVVALTSTTLGSLRLDHSSSYRNPLPHLDSINARLVKQEDDEKKNKKKAEFEVGMIEAKAWSKMMDEKIAKTAPPSPVATPPDELETINAWEMMEGLEDTSPLRPHHHHLRISSFIDESTEFSPSRRKGENGSSLDDNDDDNDDDCVSNGDETPKTTASEFDNEVISAFRKALDELSPTNPFHLSKHPKHLNNDSDDDDDVEEVLKKVNGALEAHSAIGDDSKLNGSVDGFSFKDKGYAKERLILYFTSLRGIRKTYEDCCDVKLILKGMGVRVDDRDVSMHLAFRDELRELLGETHKGGALPRVFVGEKYIGGADDIRKMHEEGSLEKALQRCEFIEDEGYGSIGGGCEACGDVRFVPCETCSGSCKVYYEVDEEEEEEEELDEDCELGFQRCPDCNENGLIRCPVCCH